MTEIAFHFVDEATGRFLRLRGNSASSRYFLSLDERLPVYSTNDIAEVHGIVRETADPSPAGRAPFGIPKLDEIDGAIYPVTAVKRYGAIVPGGDPVLLSTDLMKVELSEVVTCQSVPSRDFEHTPHVMLKRYLPEEVLEKLDAMTPEFLVLRSSEPLEPGAFVLTENWRGAKVGEIAHVTPVPDSWPLSSTVDTADLQLVLVDYSANNPSYSLTEIDQVAVAAPSRTPSL